MTTTCAPRYIDDMNKPKKTDDRFKEAAQNRKARFSYSIDETLEAGIVLVGTEVKSLRRGQASLVEAYAGAGRAGELMLINAYIAEYQQAGKHLQHEARRARELLVHKKQREKWLSAVKRDGMTIVPLSIYFNERGIAKVKLGLAKGKDKGDKRGAIKEREWNRDKARMMSAKNR